MLLLVRESIILIDQLHDLRFRPRPLALDISQCVKDCQIEINRRHSQHVPVSACCHFILHRITGVNLRETSYPAKSAVYIVLDFPKVLRYIQKLLHIRVIDRFLIVLMYCLAYLI